MNMCGIVIQHQVIITNGQIIQVTLGSSVQSDAEDGEDDCDNQCTGNNTLSDLSGMKPDRDGCDSHYYDCAQ